MLRYLVGENRQETLNLDFMRVGTHYQGVHSVLKELMIPVELKPFYR